MNSLKLANPEFSLAIKSLLKHIGEDMNCETADFSGEERNHLFGHLATFYGCTERNVDFALQYLDTLPAPFINAVFEHFATTQTVAVEPVLEPVLEQVVVEEQVVETPAAEMEVPVEETGVMPEVTVDEPVVAETDVPVVEPITEPEPVVEVVDVAADTVVAEPIVEQPVEESVPSFPASEAPAA